MEPEWVSVYRDTLQMVITNGMLFMGHSSFVSVVPRSEVMLLLAPFDAPVVGTNVGVPLVTVTLNSPATRSGIVIPSKSAKILMLCAGRTANRKRR
jgi:hypothetical protein